MIFIWQGTKACKKKNFKSPSMVKKYKRQKISKMEIRYFFFKKKILKFILLKMEGGILHV